MLPCMSRLAILAPHQLPVIAKVKPVAIAQTVEYPASDPLVSGVGGTSLLASKSGKYIGETT